MRRQRQGGTFGRFNNVDIAYDVRLGWPARRCARTLPSSPIGVATGCASTDRPGGSRGPLVDITAADVPRVFPTRYDQPSPVQPSGAVEGWPDNPVDDQNTVYGLTVAPGATTRCSSRSASAAWSASSRSFRADGRLDVRLQRSFCSTRASSWPTSRAAYAWTPCREAAEEEPQSEGLVFDRVNQTLYVAFETIGLYRLCSGTAEFVRGGRRQAHRAG